MRLKIVFIFCGISLFLSSCYRDKGNYDYSALNEVLIEGIASFYQYNLGNEICIVPRVRYSLDTLAARHWEYQWKIQDGKVIGTGKDLCYIADTLGEFTCYFKVKDSVSNIEYVKAFRLNVISKYSVGWMVLSEVDRVSRLSFIQSRKAGDTLFYDTYANVYEAENQDVLGSEPVKLREHWKGSDYAVGHGEIMVMQHGGQGCVELNDLSFVKTITTDQEFLNQVYPPGFKIKDAIHGNWSGYLLSEDGSLYTRKNITNELLHSGSFLQFPATWGGKKLTVDRLILTDYLNTGFILIYDAVNRRFLGVSDTEETATRISALHYPREGGAGFWDITGLDDDVRMIYCGYYNDGYGQCRFLALLKKGNLAQVQEFTVNRDMEIVNPVVRKFNRADLLDGNNVMTTLPKREYLLFSAGAGQKELYYYDRWSENVKLIYRFDSPVSSIAYQSAESDRANQEVAVGLENGKVYIFDVSTENMVSGLKVLHESRESFGKIVDVAYKMRMKTAM